MELFLEDGSKVESWKVEKSKIVIVVVVKEGFGQSGQKGRKLRKALTWGLGKKIKIKIKIKI